MLLTTLLVPAAAVSQAAPVTLAPGTQLPVKLPKHLPMKAGEPIRAELLYPVYQNNELILPARTVVNGTVVSLSADHARRLSSRLRADFTPFHKPVVRFTSIVAPDGRSIPIATGEATNGAPVYRVVRTPTPKGGFIARYFYLAVEYFDATVQAIIGPGKADRALQFVYSQLPYHPERITAQTSWTVETSEPVTLGALAAPAPEPVPEPSRFRLARLFHPSTKLPVHAAEPTEKPTWILQAYLNDGISSETSKSSDVIHATVAEPVLNPDGSVAVPTGSILTGTVSQAKRARKFDRAGTLRFNFTELKLPGEETQRVRTTLAGADTSGGQQLDMNAEGDVKPKAQDKIIIPALMLFLASRPLDREHHHEAGNVARKDAAASSGLGLISLIVGTAAKQANVALGIGYYSAALSIYPRFFGKGAKVEFPKDTRVVIETTATKRTALKPESSALAR